MKRSSAFILLLLTTLVQGGLRGKTQHINNPEFELLSSRVVTLEQTLQQSPFEAMNRFRELKKALRDSGIKKIKSEDFPPDFDVLDTYAEFVEKAGKWLAYATDEMDITSVAHQLMQAQVAKTHSKILSSVSEDEIETLTKDFKELESVVHEKMSLTEAARQQVNTDLENVLIVMRGFESEHLSLRRQAEYEM